LAAAQHAKKVGTPAIDDSQVDEAERELLAPFDRADGESPYQIHHDLQDVMQTLVGIFRTEQDLLRALTEIEKLRARAARMRVEGSRLFNPGWHLSRDIQCMLTVSEACTHAALARRESRGAHSRLDYAKLDDAWGRKNNIIAKKGDAMALIERPVVEMPDDLKQVLAEDT
jgi:succinate dehydrogenase / fumarate reductase flavoprotein subunit